MAEKQIRCEEVIAQIVVRTYDKQNRAISEAVTQPVKIFRGSSQNFWHCIDELIERQIQTPASSSPAPTPALKPGRK